MGEDEGLVLLGEGRVPFRVDGYHRRIRRRRGGRIDESDDLPGVFGLGAGCGVERVCPHFG